MFFIGCEKSDNDLKVKSIIDTKWTLSKIIDHTTSEITNFPTEIENFEIVFRKNGKINLPDYCNYSYGEYILGESNSINIYNVGEGTEKYCSPEIRMDWETLFINNLVSAKTYSVENNQLKIYCESNYDLVFEFVEYYDSDKGKLLFYTNSHIINCVFDIELFVNGVKIGNLDARSTYTDNDCNCDNSTGIGLLLNLKKGTYDYSANEINCIATNKVNSWSGQVNVIGDSCTVVFLNINE